jgi:hypothetical protein
MVIGTDVYKRKEIPGLFDETFRFAVNTYHKFRTFGLPFGGGYAEQPEILLRIIEIVADAVGAKHG